jgi:ABC-type Zn uptake system ZnuABC Zn-binding protein ZnuA
MRSVFALAFSLFLAACSTTGASPSPGTTQVEVVVTTTVLGDLAAQVGGSLISVHSLVPKGGDPHTFDPKPSDAAAVANADLALMNGLGLDDWLLPLVQNAGRADLPVAKLAEGQPGVDYIAGDPDEGEQYNPHLWMNVAYARLYVEQIRLKLAEIDPGHATQYDASAAAYDATLATLDRYIRDQLATVPAENRKIVAFHDAFPYFARAYGLEVVGVIVDAPGQDPSAGEIADLIAAIRDAHVKLILAEVQFPDQLVRQIASETDAAVVADLYDDTLTDEIPTYEQMLRWDVDQIVEGLR